MVCDIGRIVPRWLLSTLNFLILVSFNIFFIRNPWKFATTSERNNIWQTKQLFSLKLLLFQIITFLLLVVSVLLICVPHYIKDLLTYILSRPQLQISLVSQDSISHNISPFLLSQLGWLSLTISFIWLLPAFVGYVGAVRESRICLILVSFLGLRLQKI